MISAKKLLCRLPLAVSLLVVQAVSAGATSVPFTIETAVDGKITAVKLTCEYLENPQVVDVARPRLSWINCAEKGERGQKQTAWQIRVSSAIENLDKPDLWDSGKTLSEECLRIEYAGEVLKSRQECWWQVRVWDVNNKASEWSKPGFWRMGVLDRNEWQAKWIGVPWQGEETLPKPKWPNAPELPKQLPPPAPMFRKEIKIEKEIKKAVAFVTGLGYFEMYINGAKVGDDVLVPNQTNYGKRPGLINEKIPVEDNFRKYKVMYLAYDIKDKLKQGNNAIGTILGNGFYNPAKYWASGYGTPRFITQIYITYTDGSEEIVVSDESWKASQGPILMDLVYYGEHYDARKEQTGWNEPGFDDSKWEQAVMRKAPDGELIAHTAHPDKVMETLQPVSIKKLDDGNYLVDFGVEVSGWLRLNDVSGPEGHKVEIKYVSNLHSGENSYVFKGKGKENYAARFNWFTFSAVEIVNWPGEIQPEMLTAEVVYTYVEESATFETSNKLFNDINKIWRRSQTDNMHGGIASDCPHRERSGYTGDGQLASVAVLHNYNARNFYQKWIADIRDSQNIETGYVPNAAPWQPGCGGGNAWGAAICIMPWEFYVHYGSKDMIRDNYSAMKEYIRYMQAWVGNDGIMHSQRVGRDGNVLKWFNLGEWVTPGKRVPDELVHTFYFWRCAEITAKSARVLNNMKDADFYHQLAEKTRKAFWNRFYDEEKGSYGISGANTFALKMGVPEKQYKKVVAALRENLKETGGHLNTGIFGTKIFFEVLSENGMHDLAFEAMNKKTQPGYGYWLELGATTTRENWVSKGSHNHPMFGGGLVWYYRKLAGMSTDIQQPGYRHIIFKPMPVGDVTYAKYYNETSFGKAGIFWEKIGENMLIDISVPVGCTATVFIPAQKGKSILENGVNIAGSSFIKDCGEEKGYRKLLVQSGDYTFRTK